MTVTFSKPDAIFLFALGTMAGAVASQAFIEANGANVGTPEAGIIGHGPVQVHVVDEGPGDRARPLRRLLEHRAGTLAVKQFVVKIILDEATIVQALTTGEVDGVFGTALSGKSVQALAEVDAVSIYRAPSFQVHYLAVNTGKPPFDDVRVRQALSMAIDKAGLLASTWGGIGQAGIKSPGDAGDVDVRAGDLPGGHTMRCRRSTSISTPPGR